MGKEKAGFLTPKAIANRIKAKGLQKLRWYCQMCQKQCRDENGFKCHCMSESHQRQLLLFADNPDEYLDAFSMEFLDGYMELLRRRFGTRRVHCNIVYNEYIQDRDHIHMNSTKWQTLTEFVMWLGREGKVTVEPTEKGIFITYIDRDPEAVARQEAVLRKEKMEAAEADRDAKRLELQIERGRAAQKEVPVYTELEERDESEKVAFSFSAGTSASSSGSSAAGPAKNVFRIGGPISSKVNPLAAAEFSKPLKKVEKGKPAPVKRKSALEEIMEEEQRRGKLKFDPSRKRRA